MALRKIVSVAGQSIISTALFGQVAGGEQTVSTDCYIRVASVSMTKNSGVAYVNYVKYDDGKTGEITAKFSKAFDFSVDLEGPNPIKQAYLHLKTLPEFADAIDC